MSIVQMAERIKQIHPDYVLIFKVGTFCNTFGKDSYIISANFDYAQRSKKNIPICGFPKKVLRTNNVKVRRKKDKLYNNRTKE